MNKAGLESHVCELLQCDTEPPVAGVVLETEKSGSYFSSTLEHDVVDVDRVPLTNEVVVRWTEFTDSESDIDHMLVTVAEKGLAPLTVDDLMQFRPRSSEHSDWWRGGRLNVPFEHVQPELGEWTMNGLSLEAGKEYVSVVVAVNHAGLASAGESDGFMLELGDPCVTVVGDGLSQRSREQDGQEEPTWVSPANVGTRFWATTEPKHSNVDTSLCGKLELQQSGGDENKDPDVIVYNASSPIQRFTYVFDVCGC